MPEVLSEAFKQLVARHTGRTLDVFECDIFSGVIVDELLRAQQIMRT